jgi:hypothetical protein
MGRFLAIPKFVVGRTSMLLFWLRMCRITTAEFVREERFPLVFQGKTEILIVAIVFLNGGAFV